MGTYKEIKNVLAETMAEDLEWLTYGRVPGQKPDPVYNPWMPFQMADFIAIMAECVAALDEQPEPKYLRQKRRTPVFLDVGSGIGTKVLVARELFGLDAYGLEIDKTMHQYARDHGHRASILCDAMDGGYFYSQADIIWMYRPFRDEVSQAKLEHKIYEEMKPGAIVAGAQWMNEPSGFEIVIDDWDIGHRGAWKKPEGWQPVIYDIDESEADAEDKPHAE
jgi:SAM-dependent methyltransferase